MTQRLTILLLLPVLLILSFTPSKQVKNAALKKTLPPACATTFNIELMGCQNDPNFSVDYITVNGVQLDVNVGCSIYSGPTYVGAMAFITGPGTITIHYTGTASIAEIWDHRGDWDGWMGGWFPSGPNTITISTDLQGCGEDYTIRVRATKNTFLADRLNTKEVSGDRGR
jgi:hypothetical protein